MKRQDAREQIDSVILGYLQEGKTEEEVAEITGCAIKRVQSVRHRNGMYKRVQNKADVSRIDDFKIEERKIVGVPVIIKGKRYMDVTGDIVDCGSTYQDIGTNPYQE